jgi:hypothetical protein
VSKIKIHPSFCPSFGRLYQHLPGYPCQSRRISYLKTVLAMIYLIGSPAGNLIKST